MADRKPVSQEPHNPGEYGSRVMPRRQVKISRDGLVNGACYDGPDKLEAMYRLTAPTLKRLGLDPKTAGNPKTKPPRSGGNTPNGIDLGRWLDSLQDTPACESDIEFLLTIHATIRGRLSDAALNKLHAEL